MPGINKRVPIQVESGLEFKMRWRAAPQENEGGSSGITGTYLVLFHGGSGDDEAVKILINEDTTINMDGGIMKGKKRKPVSTTII